MDKGCVSDGEVPCGEVKCVWCVVGRDAGVRGVM